MKYTSKFRGEEIDLILDNVAGKQDAIPDLETIRSNAKNASDTIARMVESGYLFAGIATIGTNPGIPDTKVFYIANGKGKYEKFGSLEVTEDEVVVLYWDTAWHKVATGIASQAKLSELDKRIIHLSAMGISTQSGLNDGDYYLLVSSNLYQIRRKTSTYGYDIIPFSDTILYEYQGGIYTYNGTVLEPVASPNLPYKKFMFSSDEALNELIKEIYLETVPHGFQAQQIVCYFADYSSSLGKYYSTIRFGIENGLYIEILKRTYDTENEAVQDLQNLNGILPFDSRGAKGYVYLDLRSITAPTSKSVWSPFPDCSILWNAPLIMDYLVARKSNVQVIETTVNGLVVDVQDLRSRVKQINQSYALTIEGYIVVSDGDVNPTVNAAHTDYVEIGDASKLIAVTSITDAGYGIAFYDENKSILRDISVVGGSGTIEIDLTPAQYSNAKYVVVSAYDSSQIFTQYSLTLKSVNTIEDKIEQLDLRVTRLEQRARHYNSFVVLGDSYSTFAGYMKPSSNDSWYPSTVENNVHNVEETWWYLFAREYGCTLKQNNSYSGSTICYNGYGTGTSDGKTTSFCIRGENLESSDLILIFGGTNDAWVHHDTGDDTLGQFKYADWTETDKETMRPALAYLLDYLQHHHIGTRIVFILNTGLGTDYSDSIKTICGHYDVDVLELANISKTNSHPNTDGMVAIKNQLIAFLDQQ